MSRNGGYAIMDLSKYSFTISTEVGVDSSVFDITQRTKPVLISGFTLDNVLIPDFYVMFLSTTQGDVTSAQATFTTLIHKYIITVRHDSSTNLTVMLVQISQT